MRAWSKGSPPSILDAESPPEGGEPSKRPELKVIIREAPRNPWTPRGNVPVAVVVPRRVAPILPVGAATHGLPKQDVVAYLWAHTKCGKKKSGVKNCIGCLVPIVVYSSGHAFWVIQRATCTY